MQPYHQDHDVALYLGDAIEVMRALPESSVDCVVTSPPYYGLRDYGHPGQYGLEPTPAEYVDRMVDVFTAARRLLRPDGVCWLNIGDSYAGSTAGAPAVAPKSARPSFRRDSAACAAPRRRSGDLQPKNLLGMPWRIAFALQAAGWILRSAIAWHKPNAMPESVTDRMSCKYELVFLLSVSDRYWFDLEAVKVAAQHRHGSRNPAAIGTINAARRYGINETSTLTSAAHETRNPGDVWTVATSPYPEAHFAVMAPEIARRCILAGCRPGGVVLDPFSGSGTTGMVARQLGRRYIGIDLNAQYHDLAVRRLGDTPLPLGDAP